MQLDMRVMKNSYKIKVIFILLLILQFIQINIINAQVNTEAMRRSVLKEGFTSALSLSLGYQSGNTDLVDVKSTFRNDFLVNRYHAFAIMSYQHGEKDQQRYENKGFVHLRGIRQTLPALFIEIFLQKEFNEFIDLRDRNLAGSGLRIRLVNEKNKDAESRTTLFAGLGFMWENEKYSDNVEPESNKIRSTNYISLNFPTDNRFRIFTTAYYQFDIEQLNDYRLLAEGGIGFNINSFFIFIMAVNYRYDNEPPPGIKPYDLEIENTITLSF